MINNQLGNFSVGCFKQAGTGPSRRHIQGSKIAKRLPSVKYSLLQYSKIENFWKKNFRKNYILKKWTEWRAGARAKVSQCRKTERGDPLRFFNIHSVAKHEKIEENKNFHFREKISQCRKKLKGGAFGIFQHPFCRKTPKKWRGAFVGKKVFFNKSHSAEKMDHLVSSGIVCYAEKPFWFSSLDQIVQFGAIIFCRTILVSSCG